MSWKHKLPAGAPRPAPGERRGEYMARNGSRLAQLRRDEEAQRQRALVDRTRRETDRRLGEREEDQL